jgi:hypothetical protein
LPAFPLHSCIRRPSRGVSCPYWLLGVERCPVLPLDAAQDLTSPEDLKVQVDGLCALKDLEVLLDLAYLFTHLLEARPDLLHSIYERMLSNSMPL